MRQTACLVSSPIMLKCYAAHLSFTAMVQASDSMTASTSSWFKLYFNYYKYQHVIIENIKYPGSDKKPKACPKVISWQVDTICKFYKWSKCEKH